MDAKEIMSVAKAAVVPNEELDAVLRGIGVKARNGLACFEVGDRLSEKTIAALKAKGFQVCTKSFNDSGQGRSWTHTYVNADRANEWRTVEDATAACKDYACRINVRDYLSKSPPKEPARTVAAFQD